MMKKWISLLLIAAISMLGFAVAEGNAAAVDQKVIDRFSDTWVDGGMAVEIWYDDGAFHCRATLDMGNDENNVWTYDSCRYDAERDELVCEAGRRTFDHYDEATKELKSELVIENLTAEFYFDGGEKLLWNDSEGLAKRFELQRLDEAEEAEWKEAQAFAGRWGCGRATIDIIERENGSFGVEITWGSSAWECAEWRYACAYDGIRHEMRNYEPGVMDVVTYGEDGEVASRITEYEDGAATFTIDGDGMLIWNDAKENAGDGMRFERGEMPESEAAPADQ